MILGLDTATEWLHLALVDGNACWTRARRVEVRQSHSTVLLPLMDELLEEADASPAGLTGCVVCAGPGGFTSLRTGVATAEGLALTGLPTWGFSAFELRSRAVRLAGFDFPHWILLDGQRGEAFAQQFGENRFRAQKIPLLELQGTLSNAPWWAGETFRGKLEGYLGNTALPVLDEEKRLLDALCALCREKIAGPPESPIVPFYLRETDAEVNFPEQSRHLSDALRRGHER